MKCLLNDDNRDNNVIIYNSDGIKSLTALKGKYTKNELPKEED